MLLSIVSIYREDKLKCGGQKGMIGLVHIGGKEEGGQHEFVSDFLPWGNFRRLPYNASRRSVANLLLLSKWLQP